MLTTSTQRSAVYRQRLRQDGLSRFIAIIPDTPAAKAAISAAAAELRAGKDSGGSVPETISENLKA